MGAVTGFVFWHIKLELMIKAMLHYLGIPGVIYYAGSPVTEGASGNWVLISLMKGCEKEMLDLDQLNISYLWPLFIECYLTVFSLV